MRLQLINTVLRAATLGSRLALLFFLARLLPPAQLGLYGLVVVTLTYAILAAGLDFYTYSQREILGRSRSARSGIILHHATLSGLAYLVVIPLSMLAFITEYLPWWVAPWFIVLLVAEHVAQEMNRMLVALQRPLAASMVLFVRQGVWIWIVLALMWLAPSARGLMPVFACWLAGCALALVIGGVYLCHELDRPEKFDWDWAWVRRGLRTGIVFLVATLSLRGVFTFDRYVFESLAGLELLGVYTLYAGLAMAVMNFMDAGVFVFRFPPLVQAWRNRHYETFRDEWRRFVRHTILALLVLTIAAAMAGPIIAVLVGKPVYVENIGIFGWLLSGICLQVIGMIPHYGLYAMHHDRPILVAHVTGLAFFLIAVFALGVAWPRVGVPMAITASFAWILLFKTAAYCRIRGRGPLSTPSPMESST